MAAVTFGAVIRSRNQNFTFGDGKDFDGRRARTPAQLSALSKYANVLRDYCHYGDPMCAVGSEPANVWVHLDYFLGHNEEVIPWVVGKAKQGKVSTENPSGTTPSTSDPLASTSFIAKSAAAPSPTASSTTDGSEVSAVSTKVNNSNAAASLVVHSSIILGVSFALFSILLL